MESDNPSVMDTDTAVAGEADDLFSDYQPAPSRYDELFDRDGHRRPSWDYFADALTRMGFEGLIQRSQEARRLLRDSGVTLPMLGDQMLGQRPWELDPIPLLMSSDDWGSIERGLIQRADLHRRLLQDIYGPQECLRKGLVPVEVLHSHPGFLRPCHGIEALQNQHALPVFAADLARAPDGEFVVLGDRCQTAPGAGFALQNRVVLSRVLPSLYRDAHVHRLALYFRTLRQTLQDMAPTDRDNPRVVVLTPGPDSPTYFEHVYLAKYLGYTLVQGGDLVVRDNQVWLKSLDGLQAVDVILRYLNDSWCDPLELRRESLLGVTGLLQAVRAGRVAIANPIGSGVLENVAFKPYLPALARHFLGEDLLLRSPETWWCGDPQARQHVLDRLDHLVIKKISHIPRSNPIFPTQLSQAEKTALRECILAEPYQYVGQELIQPSTLPALQQQSLEPTSFVLRSFLVSNGSDYTVLPGGLARAAQSPAISLDPASDSGISKDIWVLASEPERHITGSQDEPARHPMGLPGELPSRVAENLFWLGRYAERSESIIRLLRIVLLHLLEPDDDPGSTTYLNRLLQAVTHLTETYPGFVGDGAAERLENPSGELLSVFLDLDRPGSLADNLAALLYAAGGVRDRISPDIWRVFNEIDTGLQQLRAQRDEAPRFYNPDSNLGTALSTLNQLITAFAAFTGLAIDSMTHGAGWRFLMLGRRLERAQQTLPLLEATLAQPVPHESPLLERLLAICDSLMTYRSRYHTHAQALPILHLLLQDETNPRSLCYQLKNLHDDIRTLPHQDPTLGYNIPEQHLALRALSLTRLADTRQLAQVHDGQRSDLQELLKQIGSVLPQLSDALTHSYFSHTDQATMLTGFSPPGESRTTDNAKTRVA